MGLLSRLRGDRYMEGAYDAGETRSLPRAENELPLHGGHRSTSITPAAALAIGDVWSAVRVLADAASSLPLHAYRRTDQGRERVTSGRLVDLLDNPAPAVSQADLVSTLLCHVLIYGSGYLGKFRGQGNEVTELHLLHPERVRPEVDAGQIRFRYAPGTGPQMLLTLADVVPVRGLSVDGLNGLSAVSQAATVLGLSDELVKHALSYFDTGAAGGTARPAGILRMGPDASNSARERTVEGVRNESRPHGILVIEGEAEYTAIANRLDDSQFVEQRRLAAQEVCRVFRIPGHMLNAGSGGDSLTYSTTEQLSLDFAKYSLTPWLRRIELAISNDADLAFQKQFVKFELDGLLRADAKTRAEIYAIALDPISGWMSRDEVRRLEDLEPEPEPPAAAAMAAAINAITTPTGANGNGSRT